MSATSSPNTEDNALVEFGPPRTLDVDGARAGRAAVAAARAGDGSLRTAVLATAPAEVRDNLACRVPPPPRPPLTGGR